MLRWWVGASSEKKLWAVMKFEPILSPYILLYKWCRFWNLHMCDRANILPLRGSIWGKNIVIPACWLDWHLLWGQFQQQMHLIFIYVYICGWKWWRDLTPPGWVIGHIPTVPWALYLLILVLLPYKDIWKLLFELIIFCSSMAFIWNCLLLAVSVFVGDAVWGTDMTLRNWSFHRPGW